MRPTRAAATLRDGLTGTITTNRLGVASRLAKTLTTTNPEESTVDVVHPCSQRQRQPNRRHAAAVGCRRWRPSYGRVKGWLSPAYPTSMARAPSPANEVLRNA